MSEVVKLTHPQRELLGLLVLGRRHIPETRIARALARKGLAEYDGWSHMWCITPAGARALSPGDRT